MAIRAGRQGVRARERKTVVLVQFGDVVDQPVFHVVAAGTVFPHGTVVHIRVAGNALGIRFGKNHRLVAGSAIDADVLARERKIRFGMAETSGIPADLPAGCSGENRAAAVPGIVGYFPPGRRVAIRTVHLELRTVRGLR